MSEFTYEAMQREINPPWLKDEWGQADAEARGATKDKLVAAAKDAVKIGLPAYADEPALALIGKECMLERYPDEPLEDYRARLENAFDTWAEAGSIPGLTQALAGFNLEAVVGLVREVDPARWAEFTVEAVGPDAGEVDPDLVIALIQKFKPARDKLAELLIVEALEAGYFGFEDDEDAGGFGVGPVIFKRTGPAWVDGEKTPGEGTTNILSANQSSVETDTTGLSISGGGVTVISRDTAEAWEGAASLKVVTGGTVSAQGMITGNVAALAATIYTVSAYVKGSGVVLPVLVHRNSGAYTGGTNGTPIVLTGDWQRIHVTGTTGGTANQIALQVLTSGAQATAFWVDGLQIEQKDHLTEWTLGGTTRADDCNDRPRFIEVAGTVGLLSEEASANLIKRSEDLTHADWTKTRSSVAGNAIAGPFAGTLADKLVEDTSAATSHTVTAAYTATAGQPYTMSVYAKKGERSWLALNVGGASAYFNLDTGVAGTVNTGTSTIEAIGAGWYRCSCTVLSSVGGALGATVYLATGNSAPNYTGDGASGLYLFGAQVENKAAPTTYMPTDAAAVTRSAETATAHTGGSLETAAGTAILMAYVDAALASGARQAYLVNNSDGGGINGFNIRRTSTALLAQSKNGVTTTTATKTTAPSVGWHVFGVKYSAEELALYGDGAHMATTPTPVLPTALQASTGIGHYSGNGANQWGAPIAWVAFYPFALTDAEMEAATAGNLPPGYTLYDFTTGSLDEALTPDAGEFAEIVYA